MKLTNRPRVGSTLVAIGLAGALLAAACGDDSSTSSDTTISATPDSTIAESTSQATTSVAATTTGATTSVATTTTAAASTTAAAGTVAPTTTKATTTTAKPVASTSTTSAGTTTIPKPTKSEITLGVPIGLSGSSSSTVNFTLAVAQAWEAWVNTDMGGINGHPVRLVIKDTKGDPATASAISRSMIDDDKVIASVGGGDPSSDTVWSKVFIDAKVPVIPGYIAGAYWNQTVGVFPMMMGPPIIQASSATAALANGAKKFGVITCTEVSACAAGAPLYGNYAKANGLADDGYVQVASADPNYTSACVKFQQDGVDYIHAALGGPIAARIRDDCAKQGFRPTWGASAGGVDGASQEPESLKGSTFGGAHSGFPWYSNIAPVKQFRDVMAKYAPGKEYRAPAASTAWAAFELFRKIMSNATDKPTAADVFDALYKVRNDDLNGLLPTGVSFSPGQPVPVMKCFWYYRLSNGVWNGVTPSCTEG